ncbi:phage holin family protein [Vagococcus acidifermentans]|uniref:Phage holin family protein n=1 Tax=Vagococcus acidifermentans TaxID=564710 RepID=A0A430ATQ7_9ENTE|nr:phage holin family protein [Vagococcus acidifermentans]RSU11442.1 hypothetical protein CBF27_08055 [Vagococcus acidifermentans]
MTYLQRLIVTTLAFISMAVLFPSKIYVSSLVIAFVASFVLSILNTLVRPVLYILSLPITFLTFGLFSFVINGLMLKLTSLVVGTHAFAFSSFWSALMMAVVLSIVNAIVEDHHARKYLR